MMAPFLITPDPIRSPFSLREKSSDILARGTEGSNLLSSTGESGKNCTATQRLRAEGRMRFMAPGCTITDAVTRGTAQIMAPIIQRQSPIIIFN